MRSLSTPALRVETRDGRVTGVVTPQGTIAADAVISTMPTPLVSKLVPDPAGRSPSRWQSYVNRSVTPSAGSPAVLANAIQA